MEVISVSLMILEVVVLMDKVEVAMMQPEGRGG